MRETEPALRPATVTLDFEKAAINAFHESFPDAAVTGCFYHLSQSVYRKVQTSVGPNLIRGKKVRITRPFLVKT
jgi:transposase-like protein